MNRDTESVVVLTPNIKLDFYHLPLETNPSKTHAPHHATTPSQAN
jgi:hypothetical protein